VERANLFISPKHPGTSGAKYIPLTKGIDAYHVLIWRHMVPFKLYHETQNGLCKMEKIMFPAR
jgi:hypothetical protein